MSPFFYYKNHCSGPIEEGDWAAEEEWVEGGREERGEVR